MATLDGPDGRRETLQRDERASVLRCGQGLDGGRRLERGDRIVSEREATLAVADVSLEEQPTLVYNFEVAQDHNYFVGDAGAEAHSGRRIPTKVLQKWIEHPNTPRWINGIKTSSVKGER